MPEDREVVGPSLIFGLNDRPDPAKTFLAAAAHLFAIVASILTAPLLIARAVGLDSEATQYVISASLVVSGIATFIQTFRIGIVGSGLLAVQGTSFAFIGLSAAPRPWALHFSPCFGQPSTVADDHATEGRHFLFVESK